MRYRTLGLWNYRSTLLARLERLLGDSALQSALGHE